MDEYGQITFDEYLRDTNRVSMMCEPCICRRCLYWWSSRCPYGECFDEKRALLRPYNKAHPDEPPRTSWSDWKTDQAYWCRGGVFHPIRYCGNFVKYEGQEVKECIKGLISVFQDGYIYCSLLDCCGCEQCYEELMERQNRG